MVDIVNIGICSEFAAVNYFNIVFLPSLLQDPAIREDAIEYPPASNHSFTANTVYSPDMTSSPALDANPLPLLQLEEVDSSKATERVSSPGLLPAMYSPPVGMDSHTICIPSPYTDNNHDYNHGHGPLTFYSPSMLSYTRSPITDSPSSLCPPLSPSAFWPSHTHHNVPSLTLHCTQPLVYNEPSPHAPWLDPKVHSISPSR